LAQDFSSRVLVQRLLFDGSQHCAEMGRDSGKATWVTKAKEPASAIRYSRSVLLQLKPQECATGSDSSPWTSGTLYCTSAQQLAEAKPVQLQAVTAPSSEGSKATTVTLHNVPVKYTRMRFCEKLAEHGFGYAIDFLYLPIDGHTGRNLGWASVNLRTEEALHYFRCVFEGVPASNCLPDFESSGICHVSVAEVQGREANMQHLLASANLDEWDRHEERQPLFLDDFGTKIPLSRWRGVDGREPEQRCCQQIKSQLNAETPEFVPQCDRVLRLLGPPAMRAEAKEFVPSMALLPTAEMVD